MTSTLLLATDLDRTLLPNGAQEESPDARERFARLVAHDEVIVVYVSGRGKKLLMEAIETYGIPVPDFAIGDVGTTIYTPAEGHWIPMEAWQEEIAPDWKGHSWQDMFDLFKDIEVLTLQEEDKQNTFKLSYYAPEDTERDPLLAEMQAILDKKGIKASLIWSIDEAEHTGLLDVLPESATKIHALEFLGRKLTIPKDRIVFCGDSGNDIPALISDFQSVLVRNARDEVREEAISRAPAGSLYVAKGGFLDMNGNYAAGVLEGVAHYFPEVVPWME